MTDLFRVGASWGAMRAELIGEWEDQSSDGAALDVLSALFDAIEELPDEHRDALVEVALRAWRKAGVTHDPGR